MKPATFQWPPPPQQRPPTGEESLEDLERRTERHRQHIEASKANMLRLAVEATDTGAQTLAELHAQGEQLKKIRRDQAKIDDSLSTSDRLLRGLESWQGAVSNAISGWWSGRGDEDGHAVASCEGSSKARDSAPRLLGAAGGARAAPSARSEKQGTNTGADDRDESLNQLSGLVAGLHAQAVSMNETISAQSHDIDAALSSAVVQKERLDAHDGRARKLLGR